MVPAESVSGGGHSSAVLPLWVRFLLNLVVGVGVLVWLAMEAGVLSAASATGSFVVGVLLLVVMLLGALVLGLLPSLIAPWELLTRFGVVVVGLFWFGVLLLGWVLRSPEMYAPLYALPLGAIFASHDDPLVRWGFVWLLVALVRRTTVVMRGDFVAASIRVALLVLASLLVPFGFALIAHWLYVAIVPTPPAIA